MNIADMIIHARDGVYITQWRSRHLRRLPADRDVPAAVAKTVRQPGRRVEVPGQVDEKLQQRNVDGVAEICDSPAYWNKAVPQLVLVALQNPQLSPTKAPPAPGRDIRARGAGRFRLSPVVDLDHRAGRPHAGPVGNGAWR